MAHSVVAPCSLRLEVIYDVEINLTYSAMGSQRGALLPSRPPREG